jgi:hypothetical protein
MEDVDELGSSLLTDPESVALGSFVLRMRLGVVSSPLLTARYERLEMDNRLCVLCMGALCEVGHRDPPVAPQPPGWQEGVEDRPRARLALQHILLYCPSVSTERETGLQFMDHVASHLHLPRSTMPRMALLPERQSACGVPYLEATSQVLCRLLRVTKVVIVTVDGKVVTAPPEFQRHLGVVESQGSDGGGAAAAASESVAIERVLALVAEPMRGSKTKVRLPRGTVAIVARSKSLSRLPQYGLKLVTVPPGHSLLMMHKSESPRLHRDEVDVSLSTMSELGPMSPYRVSVVVRGSVSASVHKMSAWRLVSEMARSRVEDVAMAMCQALDVDVAGGFGVCHLLRLQHEHQVRALRELPSEMSEEKRQLLRESTPNLMRGVVTSAMASLASGPTGSAKSLWLRSLSRVSVVCAMRVHATYSSRHAQQSSVHAGRHVGRRDADEGEDGGDEMVVQHQQVAAGEHDDDEVVLACEDVEGVEEEESAVASARSKRKSREEGEGEEKVEEVVMSPWQLAKRGASEVESSGEEEGSERVSRAVSVAGRVMRSSGSRDVELCTMCGDGLVSYGRKGFCGACYQRTYQHAKWLKMVEVVRKVESESGSGGRVSLVSIVAEGVKQGVKNSEEEWLRCAYQIVKGVVVNKQREVIRRPMMRKDASKMLRSLSEKEKELLERK